MHERVSKKAIAKREVSLVNSTLYKDKCDVNSQIFYEG